MALQYYMLLLLFISITKFGDSCLIFCSVSVAGNRQPAADPQELPAGSRYDWLACGTPLSCRRRGGAPLFLSQWRRCLSD